MRRLALTLVALLLGAPTAAADDSATATADAGARASARSARVVLARFATSYSHDAEHRARAFNVELAAEAIDGKVIPAGGVFSFNDAVGERTASFGFARSVVLRDGMIAEGAGGGACQVASTLHAAALLGGLEIAQRAPHSRPSAYIRMGLDATVAMGSGRGSAPIDLKLRNPEATSVTIHARSSRGTLEVVLDADGGAGRARPEVSVTSEIVGREPFTRTVERDRRAPENTIRIKAFGIPGYRVRRTREIRVADGTVRRDVRIDVYAPTAEVVVVPPSLEESRIHTRAPSALEASESSPDEPPATAPASVVVDPAASRPSLVQLRPSTHVALDNADEIRR